MSPLLPSTFSTIFFFTGKHVKSNQLCIENRNYKPDLYSFGQCQPLKSGRWTVDEVKSLEQFARSVPSEQLGFPSSWADIALKLGRTGMVPDQIYFLSCAAI